MINKIGVSGTRLRELQEELSLHYKASANAHPNIVHLHNLIDSAASIFLVITYCPDGDLFDTIVNGIRCATMSRRSSSSGVPSDDSDSDSESSTSSSTDIRPLWQCNDVVRSIMVQLATATAYLHDTVGMAHRDIKPENLFYTANGRLLIGDFGMATSKRLSSSYGVGTAFYASPESVGYFADGIQRPYDTYAADVWSIGIVLLNIIGERNPWHRANARIDASFAAYLSDSENYLRTILPRISEESDQLIKQILDIDTHNRPTASALIGLFEQVKDFVTYDDVDLARMASRIRSNSTPISDSGEIDQRHAMAVSASQPHSGMDDGVALHDMSSGLISPMTRTHIPIPPCPARLSPCYSSFVDSAVGSPLLRAMPDRSLQRLVGVAVAAAQPSPSFVSTSPMSISGDVSLEGVVDIPRIQLSGEVVMEDGSSAGSVYSQVAPSEYDYSRLAAGSHRPRRPSPLGPSGSASPQLIHSPLRLAQDAFLQQVYGQVAASQAQPFLHWSRDSSEAQP